ncbi:hypothetical protein ARMGADRAFT_1039634 [Armillaria gallica]|uniref:Uncharacterized protein n=1 Tax=Armillaria gallica TaxID=47427 RepID=A0A2H3CW85_ARMGA|nr:hypothetical protein ARMGADRAFT_1039634 [Armillaria gallica]
MGVTTAWKGVVVKGGWQYGDDSTNQHGWMNFVRVEAGMLGRLSVSMAVPRGETNSTIISGTLKNRGAEKMSPAKVGMGMLGGVLASIVASWMKMVGVITSGTLENVGVEMAAPVGVAIERGQSIFWLERGGGVKIIGRGVGLDDGI